MSLLSLERAAREIAENVSTAPSYADAARAVMQTLIQVVECDTINMGTLDIETEEGFHFALGGFLMPPERRALLPHFKGEHPMLNFARQHGTQPALRFTDLTTRRELEELGIYRECYRGYTHSMLSFGIDSPPGLHISFVLSRGMGEFSDADRQHLNILQPLVSASLARIVAQSALEETRQRRCPVGIVHGSGEFVHTLDAYAADLLGRHFPRGSRHRLAEPILSAISASPGQVLTLVELKNAGRLCAYWDRRRNGWMLRLWEEFGTLPASKLSRFRLTGRQVEVLQWIAKGKTNVEVALILGISPRTVQKHLEHIYRQLGVETRLGAVAACKEL